MCYTNNVILGVVCIEVTLMLNEERVKHMIKLADYETKGGSEEIKISSYFKKDYIRMNTLWSLIWMTIAYALCVGGVWLLVQDLVTMELTKAQSLSVMILTGGIYFALFVVYTVISRRIYKKRHARAYFRVKKFSENLAILENMYEKEEHDAETI